MTSSSEVPDWRGRRCLVTGGAGFIGRVLCARLRALGADVHVSRHKTHLDASDGNLACDVSVASQVEELFASTRPSCVFHLAGVVNSERSLRLVGPTLATNLVGTVNVLMSAVEARCSNVVVLGSLQEPDEEIPAVPSAPYAAAKLGASAYARMFARVFALPVAIARPYMVYGPGQLDFSKLVPYVARHLITGHVAELTSGRQRFDWVYIDDAVEAIVTIGSRSDLAGQTIDIGSGQLITVAEVALGVARRLDAIGRIRLGAVPDRKLEPTRVADIEATAARINWRAKYSIDEGLDRTVSWYQEHLSAADGEFRTAKSGVMP